MISYYTLLTFGFCHWLFDFKLQSEKMGKEKSYSAPALHAHVLIYTVGLLCMGLLNCAYFHNRLLLVLWALTNGALHYTTDYFTSKLTSSLYEKKDIHNFFATIGIDQYIHNITLFGTFLYFTSL